MDVTAIVSVAVEMAQARTAEAVSMAVLKRALEIQAQGDVQLVQAAVQSMPATGNPPHLGNAIDIFG
jgi:hypothetical protein